MAVVTAAWWRLVSALSSPYPRLGQGRTLDLMMAFAHDIIISY